MKKSICLIILLFLFTSVYSADLKFDGSNKIKTGSLVKGLILDMPLQEPYTEAGSDLITNGGFDTDSDWAKGTGWTIAAGVASNNGSEGYLNQTPVITTGHTYRMKYTITSYTSGSVRCQTYNDGGTYRSATGTYIEDVTVGADDTNYIAFYSNNFIGSIDNVVVKELDATTKDRTPYGNDGTVSGATVGSDYADFDGTNDLITVGNVGTTAKTLSFWINLDSTTESILEETDDVGVSVSSGTMSYGSWDNCFIDGVDTDTITTGFHNVILTSTTNVDVSALRLGLVNTTYLDGQINGLKTYNRALSQEEKTLLYESYRPYFIMSGE